METWRLLRTWDAEPGLNMGLDEALLTLPQTRPTLRFYTWKPEALSLGYFQRVKDVPNAERAPCVVRRLTGGGAIHHAHELTFSIGLEQSHPLYAGPVRESYERIHAALTQAIAFFNVRADFRGPARLDSDRTETGMCFEESTDLDLAWDGAKGVGSAQRRSRGRVLHHGSIKLGRSDLDTRVAAIWDRAPETSAPDVARKIVEVFEERFSIRFEEEEPSAGEQEHARARSAHFTSPAFVRRR